MSVDDTLTPDEVAELTKYTRRQIYTWVCEGNIPIQKTVRSGSSRGSHAVSRRILDIQSGPNSQ